MILNLRAAFVALLPIALAIPISYWQQQPSAPPVDPDATTEARALLREIDSISGHARLSGEHDFPNTVSRYSDRILELTGMCPDRGGAIRAQVKSLPDFLNQ